LGARVFSSPEEAFAGLSLAQRFSPSELMSDTQVAYEKAFERWKDVLRRALP
jgi:hypothetical protein